MIVPAIRRYRKQPSARAISPFHVYKYTRGGDEKKSRVSARARARLKKKRERERELLMHVSLTLPELAVVIAMATQSQKRRFLEARVFRSFESLTRCNKSSANVECLISEDASSFEFLYRVSSRFLTRTSIIFKFKFRA